MMANSKIPGKIPALKSVLIEKQKRESTKCFYSQGREGCWTKENGMRCGRSVGEKES